MKRSIVNKYRLIFQQATDRLVKQDRGSQISNMAAESIESELN